MSRRRRAPRFKLDLGVSRADLISLFDELKNARQQGLLSFRMVAVLRILVQIIDQLPPKRDTRVNLRPWAIAMLASALEDESCVGKSAVLAAIETLAPERVNDARFRAYVERTHRRLRAGRNRASSQLLPPPPEIVAMAKLRLRKR